MGHRRDAVGRQRISSETPGSGVLFGSLWQSGNTEQVQVDSFRRR